MEFRCLGDFSKLFFSILKRVSRALQKLKIAFKSSFFSEICELNNYYNFISRTKTTTTVKKDKQENGERNFNLNKLYAK